MKKDYLLFLIIFLFSIILMILFFPKAKPLLSNKELKIKYENVTIFAIGDSLTKGIGDENGGYPFYLKNNLESDLNLNTVEIYNYGVSGNTTKQIIKRISSDEKLRKDLKKANIITITTGGNDLIKPFKENILSGINETTFVKPLKEYLTDLEKLYSTIRKYNKDAVIYQLGIYNPFFETLKDIEGIEKVVDDWNAVGAKFVNKQKNSYYISIQQYINKDSLLSGEDNPYISKDDYFHPSSLGYEVISREFQKKITEYIRSGKNEK